MTQAIGHLRPHLTVDRGDHRRSTIEAEDLDGRVHGLLRTIAALDPDDPQRTRLRSEVIELAVPLARRLAHRFVGRGESFDDLAQVATIGLIKSIDRFEPERETPFGSYATPTIVGELKRHFRDRGWALRVPRPMQEMHLAVSRALPELTQSLGRAPTVADLAGHLGVGQDQVRAGLQCARAYATESLSSPVRSTGNDVALVDLLGQDDERLESAADRQALRQLVDTLPQRERRILALRFFGNLTQSEIATKVGISQMHVSRILSKTLVQLRVKLLTED
jgi:RNA polymerase sigma-B factor